jgi:hypothetical protein
LFLKTARAIARGERKINIKNRPAVAARKPRLGSMLAIGASNAETPSLTPKPAGTIDTAEPRTPLIINMPACRNETSCPDALKQSQNFSASRIAKRNLCKKAPDITVREALSLTSVLQQNDNMIMPSKINPAEMKRCFVNIMQRPEKKNEMPSQIKPKTNTIKEDFFMSIPIVLSHANLVIAPPGMGSMFAAEAIIEISRAL